MDVAERMCAGRGINLKVNFDPSAEEWRLTQHSRNMISALMKKDSLLAADMLRDVVLDMQDLHEKAVSILQAEVKEMAAKHKASPVIELFPKPE